MTNDVLQIDQSLMQARWTITAAADDAVANLMRAHDLPEIVARILAARGVAAERVESFLDPRLARDFPDPFALKNMAAMADDVATAIEAGKKIAVFADFDVDGATSAAVLGRFLRACGQEPLIYIPDRLAEGYGPNSAALKKLREQGADIVLMADCGTTAHQVIADGRALGLDIVILDHHEAEDTLPPATHLINPKQKGDASGYAVLAACGVSFLACVAINSRLKERGFFARQNLPEPPLKSWLDLVALGTVCDMVPLSGPNRLFVRAGFAQMARRENAGVNALCAVAGLKENPGVYHAGFVLGPRINAGGRIHQADLGARLLLTGDAEEAKNIAWLLNDCNEKRKELQAEMFVAAVNQVEDKGLADHPVIVVDDESWHPGLAGLVASRLKEKYKKPAVVVTYTTGTDAALEGRGSGRSVAGVNIAAAFIDARVEGLLVKGGGHAMAGGFTILPGRMAAFRDFLTAHVARQQAGQTRVHDFAIDGVLSVRGATVPLVKLLHDRLGPFGAGFEEPVFVLPRVRIHTADVVGEDHVRVQVGDWEGGSRLKAMAFRAADTPLGQALLRGRDAPLHLAGHLKLNVWNGRESAEMHITDAAPVFGEGAATQNLKRVGAFD